MKRIQQIVEAMLAMPELDDFYLAPQYIPSNNVPVVFLHDNKRVINAAKWGFVPSWAKETPTVKPINARSETVATSGMYRSAFKSTRCLIPADGFFEPKGDFFNSQRAKKRTGFQPIRLYHSMTGGITSSSFPSW